MSWQNKKEQASSPLNNIPVLYTYCYFIAFKLLDFLPSVHLIRSVFIVLPIQNAKMSHICLWVLLHLGTICLKWPLTNWFKYIICLQNKRCILETVYCSVFCALERVHELCTIKALLLCWSTSGRPQLQLCAHMAFNAEHCKLPLSGAWQRKGEPKQGLHKTHTGGRDDIQSIEEPLA